MLGREPRQRYGYSRKPRITPGQIEHAEADGGRWFSWGSPSSAVMTDDGDCYDEVDVVPELPPDWLIPGLNPQ